MKDGSRHQQIHKNQQAADERYANHAGYRYAISVMQNIEKENMTLKKQMSMLLNQLNYCECEAFFYEDEWDQSYSF
jgi:hypothetical protein